MKKREWPEIGDLVMATVQSVVDYGAYVTLDEYSKQGLLHISEIASSWIRNIRDVVREGQKVVLKVLRVNERKNHIDLSLRRVNRRERIEKIKNWKIDRKTESILRVVAEKRNLTSDQMYDQVVANIEKEYDLYYCYQKRNVDLKKTYF